VHASSRDFRLGRELCCRRRHSSIGTRTAISIPRRPGDLFYSGVKELAEASFRILDLPETQSCTSHLFFDHTH
jgi:hypothetical protein